MAATAFQFSDPADQLQRALEGIWPTFAESIQRGVERIERSLKEGVYDGILGPREQAYMAAHKLAGELGAFGFNQLGATARKMERLLAPDEEIGLAEAQMLEILVTHLRAGFVALNTEFAGRTIH